MPETTANDNFSPASKATLEGEQTRYFTFFNVILTLIGLTFLELILIVLPFHQYVLLAGLGVLSIIKFVLVISYFMHLRWDQILLSALFILGLILATGSAIALYFLFPAGESAAGIGGAPATVQSAGQ